MDFGFHRNFPYNFCYLYKLYINIDIFYWYNKLRFVSLSETLLKAYFYKLNLHVWLKQIFVLHCIVWNYYLPFPLFWILPMLIHVNWKVLFVNKVHMRKKVWQDLIPSLVIEFRKKFPGIELFWSIKMRYVLLSLLNRNKFQLDISWIRSRLEMGLRLQ